MAKWQWSYWGPIILPSGKVTSCNMAQRWAWLFALSVMTFKFIQPKSTGPRPEWGWEKNKWKFLRKAERKAIAYSLWEVHLQPPSLSQSTWIRPRFLHSSGPKKVNKTQEQDWCLKQEAFPSWPTKILTMFIILCIIFTGPVNPPVTEGFSPMFSFQGCAGRRWLLAICQHRQSRAFPWEFGGQTLFMFLHTWYRPLFPRRQTGSRHRSLLGSSRDESLVVGLGAHSYPDLLNCF